MTTDEYHAKFDDEHQVHFYAVKEIEDEKEIERRIPRVQSGEEMIQATGVR